MQLYVLGIEYLEIVNEIYTNTLPSIGLVSPYLWSKGQVR